MNELIQTLTFSQIMSIGAGLFAVVGAYHMIKNKSNTNATDIAMLKTKTETLAVDASKRDLMLVQHAHKIEVLERNSNKFDQTLEAVNGTLIELNGTIQGLKATVDAIKK